MEIHTEARQQRPTWAADQVNIAGFLVDRCRLGDRFDTELVQKVCGILEVLIRFKYYKSTAYLAQRYKEIIRKQVIKLDHVTFQAIPNF